MSSSAAVSTLLSPSLTPDLRRHAIRGERSSMTGGHRHPEVASAPSSPLPVSPPVAHGGWQPARRGGLWLPAVLLHLLVGVALWQGAGVTLRPRPPEPVQVRLAEVAPPKPVPMAPRLQAELPKFQPIFVPQPEVPVVVQVVPAAVVAHEPPPTQTVPAKPAVVPAAAPVATRAALPAVQEGPRTVSASAVQFLQAPQVVVPSMSRRLGESGTVVLRVLVDVRGLPKQIAVHQSSGFARLDEQALQAMRQARFKPYMENGEPQEMLVLTPIEYELLR